MSTPLTATYRVTFNYTVDGLHHKMRTYLGVAASGDVTGFNVVDRLAVGTLGLSVAMDALWTLFKPLYSAAHTTLDQAVLEQHVGIAWLPVATYQTAIVATGGALPTPAAQMTMSMRDTAFHKVRNLTLESEVTIPLKTSIPAGFGAPFTAWANGFTQVQPFANSSPWLWVRGRSNLYLGSFVSMVTDANDKLRRARGIQ